MTYGFNFLLAQCITFETWKDDHQMTLASSFSSAGSHIFLSSLFYTFITVIVILAYSYNTILKTLWNYYLNWFQLFSFSHQFDGISVFSGSCCDTVFRSGHPSRSSSSRSATLSRWDPSVHQQISSSYPTVISAIITAITAYFSRTFYAFLQS